MSEWQEYTLGDIVDIKHGYAFKGEFFSETPTTDILVTPGNFKIGGGFKSDKLKYYNGEIPDGFVLSHEDIIVTMTDLSKQADTLGYSAKVPIDSSKVFLHNQRIGLLIFKDKSFDKDFIYWLMRAEHYQKFVAGSATGATVKHSSPSRIRAFKFKAPTSNSLRKKIAKILSNYDDLIENNLKRIKLLEESARLTYEEWFLRFRVDGKKLDIDAATNLPFGWEYSGLNNISTFTNGYAFKSKDFVEYGHPVIKIKNIDGKMVDVHNTNRISANDVLKVNDKFKLHEGDLLIAMTGATVGKLGFVPYSNDACYLNQRVGKIQSEYLFFTFLALSGTSGQKQILNFAGGAAQPNISGDQILAVKNIIPAKDILDKFELLSNNALSQILNFTRKNQLLKEARDILLPRLMTGMIDTDDMDIAV